MFRRSWIIAVECCCFFWDKIKLRHSTSCDPWFQSPFNRLQCRTAGWIWLVSGYNLSVRWKSRGFCWSKIESEYPRLHKSTGDLQDPQTGWGPSLPTRTIFLAIFCWEIPWNLGLRYRWYRPKLGPVATSNLHRILASMASDSSYDHSAVWRVSPFWSIATCFGKS